MPNSSVTLINLSIWYMINTLKINSFKHKIVIFLYVSFDPFSTYFYSNEKLTGAFLENKFANVVNFRRQILGE